MDLSRGSLIGGASVEGEAEEEADLLLVEVEDEVDRE